MSFYSSSSFLSSSNSTYSSNSFNSLSRSYYNDAYRSYSSIPKYAPVSYSALKRPSYFELKKAEPVKTPTSSDVILNPKPFYNSESNLTSDDGRRSQVSFDDMTKSVISIDGMSKEESIMTKSVQNDSKEFVASAVSNVQLSLTDDLTTQVDYYLNEIDNRMICSGRQVEVESFELSSKPGLISKCMYLNGLLAEAKMNESLLDSDPVFTKNGKGILVFVSKKDAEDFTRFHSRKFSVAFSNSTNEQDRKNQKKNVTFGQNEQKPLYNSSNNQLNSSSSSSINDLTGNHVNANDILISTNSSKKNKSEGYEILTIRAKLKQRVGQNRTKHVTLSDIDSIMRNVVTIIQDEFMKRFPSGPSSAITDGRN